MTIHQSFADFMETARTVTTEDAAAIIGVEVEHLQPAQSVTLYDSSLYVRNLRHNGSIVALQGRNERRGTRDECARALYLHFYVGECNDSPSMETLTEWLALFAEESHMPLRCAHEMLAATHESYRIKRHHMQVAEIAALEWFLEAWERAEEREGPQDYRVVWEIDACSMSPAQAAQWAWGVLRSGGSTACVFDVIDATGVTTRVDLTEIAEAS